MIQDNGRGFTPEIVSAPSKTDGFGLTGIVERVRMLGGTHTIVSAPDDGTKVKISIVLKENK